VCFCKGVFLGVPCELLVFFRVLGLLVALLTSVIGCAAFYWVFDIYNFTYQKKGFIQSCDCHMQLIF
jgi:hypothetical protein